VFNCQILKKVNKETSAIVGGGGGKER